MNNYKNYDVAVINYPLMDPSIKSEDSLKYFKLNEFNVKSWEVPLYIHIPFCKNICKFCIYSRQVPDSKGEIIKRYVDALKREIQLYGSTKYVNSLKIGAIFFGGGTPTCLSKEQIKEVLGALKDYLPFGDNIEITMECNIQNTDEEKIQLLSELGVTRISTGVQTFNEKFREMMDMKTSTEEVHKWINMVKKYRFEDLSIDLLYGLPGQTLEEWVDDINIGLSLPVGHFSIYKLTVFAYTRLYKELKDGRLPPIPNEETLFKMYMGSDRLLKENAYNLQSSQEYCLSDKKTKFWELTYDGYGDNISFGTFSFGFINGFTYQNIIDPEEYIRVLNENRLPIHMVSHRITSQMLKERTMILGFRRAFVGKNAFAKEYGSSIEKNFKSILDELSKENLIKEYKDEYRLTTLGEYCQGSVSASFMESTFKNVSSIKKKMAIGMHITPDAL